MRATHGAELAHSEMFRAPERFSVSDHRLSLRVSSRRLTVSESRTRGVVDDVGVACGRVYSKGPRDVGKHVLCVIFGGVVARMQVARMQVARCLQCLAQTRQFQ